MLNRIWQHRYQGLLAACLIGVAAAILVMLLPERQQAFARFVLAPSSVQGTAAQGSVTSALLDDQRIVTRVLQQIDIEPPNPLDPRPVDPIDAFKRNFGLRATGQPDEFEVSYTGRSDGRALEGVSSWIDAARSLYGNTAGKPDATPQTPVALTAAQTKEQSLSRSVNSAQAELEAAQQALARFDRTQAAAAKKLTAARAARERARQEQQRQTQEAAGNQQVLSEALASRQAARQTAAQNLRDLQARLAAAGQSSGEQTDRAATEQRLAEARLLERQATAVRRELAQVTERSELLASRLSQTPEQITEVISAPAPVAPAITANKALIAREQATLTELRVRFTDNHPDVRRQLAIIADLESPGQSQVSQAPTIGARSVTRGNPVYREIQAEQLKAGVRADSLRERLSEIEAARSKAQAALATGKKQQASGQERQQVLRSELQQKVATAQTALAAATRQEEIARDALAAAGSGGAAQALEALELPALVEPTPDELAALKRERQTLADQLNSRQASRQEAGDALALARQETARIKNQLPVADTTGVASAGLLLVQGPQVVPALSNPYRPQWLLAGLLGSLLVGALVACLLGLRRNAFHDVNELERITGMRALGAVPRFASRGRAIRALWSVLIFALVVLLYGLVYLLFIAMVEKGGGWWPIDWPAVKSALLSLGQNVSTQLELDPAWLNFGSKSR